MSQLSDLEKLKKDVENIKNYLINNADMLHQIYSDTVGYDWDVCRENLEHYYLVLNWVENDLFAGIENEYYNDLRTMLPDTSPDLNKINQFIKRIRQERRREIGEKRMMRQEDISVSKGGKTRKNRKPRK